MAIVCAGTVRGRFGAYTGGRLIDLTGIEPAFRTVSLFCLAAAVLFTVTLPHRSQTA